ncbi:MAG: type III-B CRISPR module RAMP protein Cmr6, partial [Bacteroidota bacterium]
DNFAFWYEKAVHFIQVEKNKPDKMIPFSAILYRKNIPDFENLDNWGRPERTYNFLDQSTFSFKKDQLIELLQGLKEKQASQAAGLGTDTCHKALQCDGALVAGLGKESVYETSMTLHHTYGIPYLPASNIKGICRSWVIYSRFENDPARAMKNPGFASLFGGDNKTHDKKARKGNILFLEAFPASPPTLQIDMMNPHHSKYYGDSKSRLYPHDHDSPIPVYFMTLGEKDVNNEPLQFNFHLISTKDIKLSSSQELLSLGQNPEGAWLPGLSPDSNLADLAMYYLSEALEEQGIGAKTALGYGFFTA